MNMKTANQQLADAALQIAAYGMREYLTTHQLTASMEAKENCLRATVKLYLPEALKDAQEACACHMDQIAEATFKASMINAGIAAAKECGMPTKAMIFAN